MSKHPEPRDPEESPSPWLEAGMQAGFGGRTEDVDDPEVRGAPQDTLAEVLGRLETATGQPSHVFLRDEPDSFAPVLKPIAGDDGPHADAGKYSLQGEIARGGVGIVLKGHDRDLGRDVALKFLRDEYRSNPSVLQRFVEEAQIGGQLQHPGIVPVYDLGVEEGRPYFTMKLIKGRTLAALLEERQDPRADRGRMLDIFEAVCQTMAYAHARGVIHRDLKPANVMVGAFGEVQVVDWGLAKVLRTGGTSDEKKLARRQERAASVIETVRSQSGPLAAESVTGSVMGTPSYMPPEQANGDVERMDERSDVFSLGAVLCEILTGRPPYPGDGEEAMEMARRCATDDARERLAKGDADEALVALCEECFRPAPGARPRSAQVLADRIADHLHSVEERSERARIDAAEQRVKAAGERKARRLTLVLAATVLVTSGLGTWSYVAVDAAARERRAGVETKVVAALGEADIKFGLGDWSGSLAAARRAHDLLSPEVDASLRSKVTAKLAETRSAAASAEARTELARRNDALLRALADVRHPEGHRLYATDWAAVAQSYRDVFAADGLRFDGDDAGVAELLDARGIAIDLAAHLAAWAQAAFRAEDVEEARRLTRIADLCDTNDMRRQLRASFLSGDTEELKSFAASEDLEKWPPATLELLGGALMRKEAKRSALRVYRRAQRAYPADFVLTLGLARALNKQVPPRRHEAASFYRAAFALRPASVETRHELGMLYEDLPDSKRAREVYEDAVAASPKDGHLLQHLAHRMYMAGDYEGALAMYEKSFRYRTDHARAYVFHGLVLRRLTRTADSVASFRKALAIDPLDEMAHGDLVSALLALKRHREVISEYTELTKKDPTQAVFRYGLGMGLLAANRLEEAATEFRAALRRKENYALARLGLGRCLRRSGRIDDAIDAFRAVVRRGGAPSVALMDVSIEFRSLGRIDDAILALRESLRVQPGSPQNHTNLALLYMDKGDYATAVSLCERALALGSNSAMNHYRLGTAQLGLGKLGSARRSFREAFRLAPKSHTLRHAVGAKWARIREFDAAIVAFGEAVDMSPNYAEALCDLGHSLLDSGRAIESLPYLRKGHEIGSKRQRWPYRTDRLVARAVREAAREPRLLDLIAGEAEPAGTDERLEAAAWAAKRGLLLTAVRLFQEAFAADPDVLSDLSRGARYDAACAAALASRGRGEEARGATAATLQEMRDLAVSWLNQDLRDLRDLGRKDPDAALARLRHARTDHDLAAIRSEGVVDHLPEKQQSACRKLWSGIDKLIRKLED